MKLLGYLVSTIAPDLCIGCGYAGIWLCGECQPTRLYPEMCHVCRKPSTGSLTCKDCKGKSYVSALYVVSALEGLPKELIWAAKYVPSRSAAQTMGLQSSRVLPYLDFSQTVLAHIPTAPSRVRERAFDQALEMARAIEKQTGLSVTLLLRRLNNHHQVGSSRKERFEHMKDAFLCIKPKQVSKKTIVLVDDVYTTGATMESAARVLKKAGAKRVIGLVFARAE